MYLIKDMLFWELVASSSMVHTVGCLLVLLDFFFVCNPMSYGLGVGLAVEQESLGSLVYVVLGMKHTTSSLCSLV